jgi:uncharacterized repeat protein (TIGR03803 family)
MRKHRISGTNRCHWSGDLFHLDPGSALAPTVIGRLLFCAAVSFYIFAAEPNAFGQYTILHNFGPTGPAYPRELVSSPDGDLFGVTFYLDGYETLYEWTTTGFSRLRISFPNREHRNLDDLIPYNGGILCAAAPNLHSNSPAAICYLSKGSPLWTLHVWGTLPIGIQLQGPLVIGPNGNIYGTTSAGTAYRLSPVTHQITVLHTFNPNSPTSGLLLANDGNFYGTTDPTLPSNHATIYMMTPNGTVTTLYTFADSSDGLYPLIQGSDGNFYGTTTGVFPGGQGSVYGTVFQMRGDDHSVKILHTFQYSDGSEPSGLIQGPNGNLYGVTSSGGNPSGDGVIFEVTTDGSSFSVLHYFADGSVPNDGYQPFNLVLAKDNNLYGATMSGGANKVGTLYKISP